VGKLRSHATKEVADLAKEIVKKWKNEVEKAKLSQGGTGKAPQNGKLPGKLDLVMPFYPVSYRLSIS